MEIIHTTIEAGLSQPVKVLHISDSHYCLADERDGQRKIDLAAIRIKYDFGGSHDAIDNNFTEQLNYGKKHCDLIVHTGDIIDFRSVPNLEVMKRNLQGYDVFYAVGSHEFSLYIGEAKEDTAYKMQSYQMIENASPNKLDFAVRIVRGVRFISLDNSYYLFTKAQKVALEKELKIQMPTILCMHTPLYHEDLFHDTATTCNRKHSYLVATPDKYRMHYPPEQIERQKADEATLEMCDLINSNKQIIGILAGHLHKFYRHQLPGGAWQICAGAGFKNEVVELTIF